jgi:hypothetical protein
VKRLGQLVEHAAKAITSSTGRRRWRSCRRVHPDRVYRKLGVRTRSDLARPVAKALQLEQHETLLIGDVERFLSEVRHVVAVLQRLTAFEGSEELRLSLRGSD